MATFDFTNHADVLDVVKTIKNAIPQNQYKKFLLGIADAYDAEIKTGRLRTIEDCKRVAVREAKSAKNAAIAAGWPRELANLLGIYVAALGADLAAEMAAGKPKAA